MKKQLSKILFVWLLTVIWISSTTANFVNWEDLMCKEEVEIKNTIWNLKRKEWTTEWEKIIIWMMWIFWILSLAFVDKIEKYIDWDWFENKKK